jgi:hypothetical protein
VTDAADAGSSAQHLLDERYGRGRRRKFDRRLGWFIGGALVLFGIGFLFFSGWHEGSDLDFKDLDYSVVDERTVEVTMQVTAPAGSEVVCAIEAVSESYATVGWKTIELEPSETRTRQLTATLVTTSPATTGSVRSCWVNSEA